MSARNNIKVVSVKKSELNARGIRNFQQWQSGNVLYIGRNMSHYIEGAVGSKWANPFKVDKYGREACVQMYEEHVMNTPHLWNALEELQHYEELGCWCKPDSCHGDVLLKLLNEKIQSKPK